MVGDNLEGLVVVSASSAFLNVGDMADGDVVKLTLLLAILDSGVRPVEDDTFDILELVVFVPHLTTVMDDVGHG